ncbi:hypothetical protein KKB68_02475, partial [Patescibacteria group bacterium]|nr:hypothetical protein [Patescibacteria group bacterium]
MEKLAEYISLKEASSLCEYSQEYLSLRARQDKFKAYKIGNVWCTTKKDLADYIRSHKGMEAAEKIFPQIKIEQVAVKQLESVPQSQYVLDLGMMQTAQKVYQNIKEEAVWTKPATAVKIKKIEKVYEKAKKIETFKELKKKREMFLEKADLSDFFESIGLKIQAVLRVLQARKPLAFALASGFLIFLILGLDLFLSPMGAKARFGNYQKAIVNMSDDISSNIQQGADIIAKSAGKAVQGAGNGIARTAGSGGEALISIAGGIQKTVLITGSDIKETISTAGEGAVNILEKTGEGLTASVNTVELANQKIDKVKDQTLEIAVNGFNNARKTLGISVIELEKNIRDSFDVQGINSEIQQGIEKWQKSNGEKKFLDTVGLGMQKTKQDLAVKLDNIGGVIDGFDLFEDIKNIGQKADETKNQALEKTSGALLTIGEGLQNTGVSLKQGAETTGKSALEKSANIGKDTSHILESAGQGVITGFGQAVDRTISAVQIGYKKYDQFTSGLANLYTIYKGYDLRFSADELKGEIALMDEGLEIRKVAGEEIKRIEEESGVDAVLRGLKSPNQDIKSPNQDIKSPNQNQEFHEQKDLIGKRAEIGSLEENKNEPSVLIHEQGNLWIAGNIETEGVLWARKQLKVGNGFVVDKYGKVIASALDLGGRLNFSKNGLNFGDKFIIDGASGDLETRGDLTLKSGFLEIGFDRNGEARFFVDDKSGNIFTKGSLTVSKPSLFEESLDVDGDLRVDGATLRVVASSDRVGIKTANPQYDLDVNGNMRVAGDVIFEGSSTTNGVAVLSGSLVLGDGGDTIAIN